MMLRPLFSLVATLVLLAGCSLQSTSPEKTLYQFGSVRPAMDKGITPRYGSLRVLDFRAAQINRSASIIYRETDQRYVADPYRLFVAAPGVLLAERTRHWLNASGLFRSVVPAGSQLLTDHLLEGELVDLHVDVRDPKHPAAVLALRAWLIDANGHAKLPSWNFSQRVALDNASAASAAAGFDRALSAALTDLEHTLALQ